jgi:membrane-associated phospholipid phosphatase
MMEVPRRSVLITAWLLNLSVSTAAQSLPLYPNQTPGPAAQTFTPSEPPQRRVSWKLLPLNVLRDQKKVWLFPASLAHGRHWAPTAGLVSATAGLVALDPHVAPYFRQTQTFDQFNRVFTFNNTVALMAAVPTTAYLAGLVRHDSYSQQTAELAAEAVLASEIPALVMRDVSRRLSPGDIPPNGNFSDTSFQTHKGPFYLGPGGFPSGHTVAAFSIATVFAERYRRHRWVPWTAYGLAGLVGFSRITLQAHFPSDVFVGALLGYTITHYIVLRR